MAFWIFKCNPEIYRFAKRLADPNPTLTWLVTRYRDEIEPGDTVFLWETGEDRGIRAVMRVDEAPRKRAELATEQSYWVGGDTENRWRVFGTLTHRAVSLPQALLLRTPGLENLSVFHGFKQATNFRVSPEEGAILMRLVDEQ